MIVEGISKTNVILRTDRFELYQNNAIAIVGKNGKGKTTLLRILSGNLLPDSGTMIVGMDLYSFPLQGKSVLRYQRRIRNNGIYIEGTDYLHNNFKCVNDIDYYFSLGEFDKTLFYDILHQLEFDEIGLFHKIKSLSLGTKQKLSVSLALASEKPIILLDEPTLGLDIESKKKFVDLVTKMKASKAIVVSTNDPIVIAGFDQYLLCENDEVKLLDEYSID